MNLKLVAFVVIFFTNFRICQSRRYDNYSLFHIVPTEQDHMRFLQNLEQQKYIDLIFWKKPTKLHEDVQLIVNPIEKNLFLERAQHFKLKVTTLLTDVQKAFDNQTIKAYRRLRTDSYSWKGYHTLEDIYQWLSDIALKFSSVLELKSIGNSVENRDIYVLTLKKNKGRASVIVEGGIHGNEWISTEFVLYLANQLIHANSSKNAKLIELSGRYTWHFIPILNPDGYQFSHNEDRLWRKNVRVIGKHAGVDLNRNFPYSFGTHGTSSDPKEQDYCGATALSEPESKTLADFVFSKKNSLKFYFAFHAYGQRIIIPYGDRVNHLENYSEMENYSKQAVMKMYYKYGVKYRVGTVYDTLGTRISGNTASWVKKIYNIKYVFTILLRDNGSFGYALPADQIEPTCDEALTGVVELMTAKPRKITMFSRSPKITENYVLMCLLAWLWK